MVAKLLTVRVGRELLHIMQRAVLLVAMNV